MLAGAMLLLRDARPHLLGRAFGAAPGANRDGEKRKTELHSKPRPFTGRSLGLGARYSRPARAGGSSPARGLFHRPFVMTRISTLMPACLSSMDNKMRRHRSWSSRSDGCSLESMDKTQIKEVHRTPSPTLTSRSRNHRSPWSTVCPPNLICKPRVLLLVRGDHPVVLHRIRRLPLLVVLRAWGERQDASFSSLGRVALEDPRPSSSSSSSTSTIS